MTTESVTTETTETSTAETTATTAVETKPWYESSLDESTRGWLENKGFFKKDSTPEQVLAENAKAYRELEKFVGGDKEQLLKLPKDDSPEAWNDIYKKMGKPESADKYEIKLPDGAVADDKTLTWFKETAFAANMSGKDAQKFIESYEAFKGAITADAQKAMEAEHNVNMNELRKEWSSQYDERMELAKRAGLSLGLTEGDIDIAAVALGPKLYNMLAKVGDSFGEDRRITGESKSNYGMSPAGAKAKLEEYTAQKLLEVSLNKNTKEYKEWQMLNDVAYGTQNLATGS